MSDDPWEQTCEEIAAFNARVRERMAEIAALPDEPPY